MMMHNKVLLQEFEKILKCKGIKDVTINRKLFQAGKFLQWLQLEGRELVDSRPLDIMHYFETKSYCRDVRVQNLHAIKMLYDLCIEKEMIFENPASSIEIIKERIERHYDVPTYEEIQAISKLILKTDSLLALRDFTMIELAYGSGARAGEIIALNVEDIDTDEKRVLLKGKGRGANKERYVPLTDITLKAIADYCKKRQIVCGALFVSRTGRRMTNSAVYQRFILWSKKKPHIFRHAFATHLLCNGCAFEDIAKMLGHERPSTTAIYTHIPQQEVNKKVNQFHPRNISI